MSSTLFLTVTCDGCGKRLATERSNGTQEGFVEAISKAHFKMKSEEAFEDRRNYKKTRHFCKHCANGVPAAKVISGYFPSRSSKALP